MGLSMDKIKVLVVDDHALMRDGIRASPLSVQADALILYQVFKIRLRPAVTFSKLAFISQLCKENNILWLSAIII